MHGLTILAGSGTAERLAEAIALLAAQRALDGGATLFCTGDAVRWLAASGSALEELLDDGARVIVCQTSLDAQAISAEAFDPRIEAGGMVSLLQGLGEDRLIAL